MTLQTYEGAFAQGPGLEAHGMNSLVVRSFDHVSKSEAEWRQCGQSEVYCKVHYMRRCPSLLVEFLQRAAMLALQALY